MNGIVLIGMPGSGKTTLAKILEANSDMIHVSSGDIARHLAQTDEETKINLARGGMASEQLMKDEIYRRLYGINYHNKEFILDGFPRNVDQLYWLADKFPSIKFVLIECDRRKRLDRIRRRNRHDDTPEIYTKREKYYVENTEPIMHKDIVRNNGAEYNNSADIHLQEPARKILHIVSRLRRIGGNYNASSTFRFM